MDLEKKYANIKWFKKGNLRIRVKNEDKKSIIAVTLDGYNICFKLTMFDFIDHIKQELSLDVYIEKEWDIQRVFIIDSNNDLYLVNYILDFVNEWNIGVNENTVSDSDIISDELWYREF